MMGVHTYRTADGTQVRIDADALVVTGSYRIVGRCSTYEVSLPFHELSRWMVQYLREVGPNYSTRHTARLMYAGNHVIPHLVATGYPRLSAEAFATIFVALKAAGLNETTRRDYAGAILRLMRWACRKHWLTEQELLSARLRFRKAFRGYSKRKLEEHRQKAVAPAEFVRLLTAVRMELEECRALLDRPAEEQDAYDPLLPLLPFVMLLGLTLAVRSAELNMLDVIDIERYPGDIWVHAPNKASARIFLPPGVREALAIAQRWMARYRLAPTSNQPLLVLERRDEHYRALVRMDTVWVQEALRRFYRKYFTKLTVDSKPVLYRDGANGVLEPYWLGYSSFRSAAITEAARHESNPEKLRIFARHQHLSTTYRHYVREAHLAWVEQVALSMKPSAELLRMAMRNRLVTDSAVRDAARAAGAVVPGGHCDKVLARDYSCSRASACQLCDAFRIHPNRRDIFVQERDRTLDEVKLCEAAGYVRDAQNMRQLAALNQAIIDRIDEYLEEAV